MVATEPARVGPRWPLLLGLLLCGCDAGRLPPAAAAREALSGFVDALHQRDRDALRPHVSIASRDYLAQIVLPATGEAVEIELGTPRVEGPRAVCKVVERRGGERTDGDYVLVREDGRWRVDLVETAGLNSREIPREGPPLRWKLVPVPAVAERVR